MVNYWIAEITGHMSVIVNETPYKCYGNLEKPAQKYYAFT